MSRRPPTARLTARDQALIAEVVGYLRGIASGSQPSLGTRPDWKDWAAVLASRLRNIEHKLWPLDG